MDTWLRVLTIVGALMTGLMAGVFFAFSTAVMPGLARLDGSQGLEAMQRINRAILTHSSSRCSSPQHSPAPRWL
jgi:uncharacterized membrane protein